MAVYYPQAIVTLNVAFDDHVPEDPKKFGPPAPLPPGKPLALYPRELEVTLNDYKTADKAKVTLDYDDFPFDPRAIRALGVSVHIEDMESLDEKIVPRAPNASDSGNTVFLGFADEQSMSFDDQRRQVTFECRDFTGLLIDAKWPGRPLAVGEPVSQVISGLLAELPATQKIKLVKRPKDLPDPIVSAFFEDSKDPNMHAKPDDTYWDKIQDVVSHAGLICYMELDKLILTKPQTLFSDTGSKQFFWGKNLQSLKFKRKLGKMRGLNILIRSVSGGLDGKKPLEVKYPKDAGLPEQTIQKVDTSGQLRPEVAPYYTFVVANMASQQQGIAVAERIWQEMARQEIEGDLKTKDMQTVDKEGRSFDLTQLRIGTPIQVVLHKEEIAELSNIDAHYGFQDFNHLAHDDKVKYLQVRGYDVTIARQIANAYINIGTPFYTKSVTMRFGDEGFSCDVNFINFIQLEKKGLLT